MVGGRRLWCGARGVWEVAWLAGQVTVSAGRWIWNSVLGKRVELVTGGTLATSSVLSVSTASRTSRGIGYVGQQSSDLDALGLGDLGQKRGASRVAALRARTSTRSTISEVSSTMTWSLWLSKRLDADLRVWRISGSE